MSFVHFGCWGNLNKKAKLERNDHPDKNKIFPLFHVIEAITNDKDRKNIKFVSVAGDNYYPDKLKDKNKGKDKEQDNNKGNGEEEKKETLKIINPDNVKTIMTQLSTLYLKLKANVYLLYGNHEVSDKGILHGEKETSEKRKCLALTEQVNYVQTIRQFNPQINILNFMETMHVVLNADTIVIMLDTTIYDKKEENKKDHMKCYKDFQILYKQYMDDVFDGKGNNGKMSNKHLRLIQLMQVVGILSANMNKRNIIFTGHHPILSFKVKDGVDMDFNLNLQLFFRRLNLILNQRLASDSSRIYYLCADTHLYEKSNIQLKPRSGIDDYLTKTIHITQYIVGTGGTDLDKHVTIPDMKSFMNEPKNQSNFEFVTFEPNTNERFDNIYGYLKIKPKDYDTRKIGFHFVKVVSTKGDVLWQKPKSLSRSRIRTHSISFTPSKPKQRTRRITTRSRSTLVRKRGRSRTRKKKRSSNKKIRNN